MKLPKHLCGLYLEHNAYKDYYETINSAVDDNREYFKDETSINKSLETGELWTIQWYPKTPIGFVRVAAPTLEELLEYANSEDEV